MLRLHQGFTQPLWLALLITTSMALESSALSQDFRVATTVSQGDVGSSKWTRVASSVTLFHAGKVYDSLGKGGEVVIYEPAESRFVLLSFTGNNLATSIRFEELLNYLKVAKVETESHIQRLNPAATDKATRQRRAALLFQLNPEFEETYDPSTKRLTLLSPLVRYEVQTDLAGKPLVAQQYLQYADWAARMNYVLHSGTLYPDVRLAVNRVLSKHGRIPTEVRLLLEGDTPLKLKAEHKFDWKLTSSGQLTIRRCEKARIADETRWVSFREYQRKLVASARR